jgi:hypothetical protein
MNENNGYDNVACTEDTAEFGVTECDKTFPSIWGSTKLPGNVSINL